MGQWKLCLYLWLSRSLNSTLNLARSLIPSMSLTLKVGLFGGLIRPRSSLLNSEML